MQVYAESTKEVLPPGLNYSVQRSSVLIGRQNRNLSPQGAQTVVVSPTTGASQQVSFRIPAASLGDLLDLQSCALTFTAQYTQGVVGTPTALSGVAIDPMMLINRMQVRISSQSLLNQNESGFAAKMRQAYFGNDRQDSVLIGDFQSSDEYTSVVTVGGAAANLVSKYSNQAILIRACDAAYNILGQQQTFVLPLLYLQSFFNNQTLLPIGLLGDIQIDLFLAPSVAACCVAVPAAFTPGTPDVGAAPGAVTLATDAALTIGSMQMRFDVVMASELLQQSLQMLASSDSPLQIPVYVQESASLSLAAAGRQTLQVSRTCYSLERMYLGRSYSADDVEPARVKGVFYNGALQNYQVQSADGKFFPLTPYRDMAETVCATYNGLGGYYTNERRANFTRKALQDIDSTPFGVASGARAMSAKSVIITDFGKLRGEDTKDIVYNGLATNLSGSILSIFYNDQNVGTGGGVFATNQARIQLEFLRVIHIQNRTVSIPV